MGLRLLKDVGVEGAAPNRIDLMHTFWDIAVKF
jgi:hypothetical protein